MTNAPFTPEAIRELPLGPRGEVEIVLPAGAIRVRGIAGDRVVVHARGGHGIDREVAIDASPGHVRIRDADDGYRLGPIRMRAHRSGGLDIDVPRDARVSLRTLSGDVEATGIGRDSRWATASGDLRLGIDGGSVAIESMSGDVTLASTSAIGITARSVSGDLRFRAPRIEGLSASTTSGDVRIEAALQDGGGYEISSVSGDVELSTPSPVRVETQTIAGDVRASGSHVAEGGRGRRTLVVGGGSIRVSIRTTSGDIRLRGEAAVEDAMPVPPVAPEPPTAPEPPAPTRPAVAIEPLEPPTVIAEAEASPNLVRGETSATDRREAARLEVLRALERGELDVEAASHRLEVLEDVGPRSFRGWC
jgi:Toastrack DUF4097